MVHTFVDSFLAMIATTIMSFLDMLTMALDLDFQTINDALPALKNFETAMVIIGAAVVFFCIITEALQLVSTPLTGQQKNGFMHSFFRWIIGAILVASVFNMFMYVNEYFLKGFVGYVLSGTPSNLTIGQHIGTGLGAIGSSLLSPTMTTAGLIVGLIIIIQFIRLALSLVTTYVKYVFAAYLSPMCVAFFSSPTTTNIASSWLKLTFSELLSYIIKLWGMYVMCDALMDNNAYAINFSATLGQTTLVRLMFVFVFGQVLIKLDDYMNKLGFNTMPNGGGGMGASAIMMMGMRLAQGIGRFAGGRSGGSNGGSGSTASGGDSPSINKGNSSGSVQFTGQGTTNSGGASGSSGGAGGSSGGTGGSDSSPAITAEDFNNARASGGTFTAEQAETAFNTGGRSGGKLYTSGGGSFDENGTYWTEGRQRNPDGSFSRTWTAFTTSPEAPQNTNNREFNNSASKTWDLSTEEEKSSGGGIYAHTFNASNSGQTNYSGTFHAGGMKNGRPVIDPDTSTEAGEQAAKAAVANTFIKNEDAQTAFGNLGYKSRTVTGGAWNAGDENYVMPVSTTNNGGETSESLYMVNFNNTDMSRFNNSPVDPNGLRTITSTKTGKVYDLGNYTLGNKSFQVEDGITAYELKPMNKTP